ncbi:hypothetical protein K438DRAFT_2001507 [Mycena galopus ATCC 62051]|nr:hypothetical protein K438DRAFT_2001507 [Mycena galopus ATCC 62051]
MTPEAEEYEIVNKPESDPDPSEGDSEWSAVNSESMPPLRTSSSSEESDICYENSRETFESRLHLWERALAEQETRARNPLPRAHRIGDIMGDSACSFLEFMQPYPGDEFVPWSDERRDGKRFRVTRVSRDFYEINDIFTKGITILPLAFLRVPHFQIARWYSSHLAQELELVDYIHHRLHEVTVDDLLINGVAQYFEEIRRDIPSIGCIHVEKIPRALEDDNSGLYLLHIPFGDDDLHEEISEATLMSPKLDLVNWVHRRKLKFTLREYNLDFGWATTEEEHYLDSIFGTVLECLYCGGVQVPPGSMKGITRTASTPRIPERVVAKPLIIVVLVNGNPVRALVDSGSLGDLISTTVADQLRLKRSELADPITLQLAVQGSRSKINHSVTVNCRYQDINADRTFFVANLSGYDMILGTAWLYQHKELPPREFLQGQIP